MPELPVTFIGPPIDDWSLYSQLPLDLRTLLKLHNGFTCCEGALHIRGASFGPPWHSLRDTILGPRALRHRYWRLGPDDVPFAETAFGDQWFLRRGEVVLLWAETGAIEPQGLCLEDFLAETLAHPAQWLRLDLVHKFNEHAGQLRPGDLLSASPPFSTLPDGGRVELRVLPAAERMEELARLAAAWPDDRGRAKAERN